MKSNGKRTYLEMLGEGARPFSNPAEFTRPDGLDDGFARLDGILRKCGSGEGVNVLNYIRSEVADIARNGYASGQEGGWRAGESRDPVYGLTDRDFERPGKTEPEWISVRRSAERPRAGENCWLAGYVYRGVIEYVNGEYVGGDEWDTVFNDGNSPMFTVLYWKRVEPIDGIEEEC